MSVHEYCTAVTVKIRYDVYILIIGIGVLHACSVRHTYARKPKKLIGIGDQKKTSEPHYPVAWEQPVRPYKIGSVDSLQRHNYT